MKLFRQLLIILGISILGEFINKLFNLPVPGNVIGMIILFLCLCSGIIKLDMISEISSFLLDHLAFFFIPSSVALVVYFSLLKADFWPFLGISFITTIIVMVITGKTVELFKRGKKE